MELLPHKLFQPLADHLEAMIVAGHYAPGTRLPALRVLADKFGLTLSTAARGIDYLADKGLLESRRGSGIYVCGRRNGNDGKGTSGRAVAVFSEQSDLRQSYCAHIIRGVERRAAEEGVALHLYLRYYGEITQEMIAAAAQQADALLLVGSYDWFLKELPPLRPCVGVDMQLNFGMASLVGMDTFFAVELACDFFAERGFRHVKVIACTPPLYQYRCETFAVSWQRRGGSCEIIQTPWKWSESRGRAILTNFDSPEVGYLFVSGSECQNISAEYVEITGGRSLPDDFTILSLDGKSLLVPEFIPQNTITPDYAEVGEQAMNECLRRIENPGARPRRIGLSGTFVERQVRQP